MFLHLIVQCKSVNPTIGLHPIVGIWLGLIWQSSAKLYYLALSRAILGYLGLSWDIFVYLGLSWSILVYLGLSRAIYVNYQVQVEAGDCKSLLFETFWLFFPPTGSIDELRILKMEKTFKKKILSEQFWSKTILVQKSFGLRKFRLKVRSMRKYWSD